MYCNSTESLEMYEQHMDFSAHAFFLGVGDIEYENLPTFKVSYFLPSNYCTRAGSQ